MTTKPHIEKLGTIGLDIAETTPVVFRNRLLRLESIRHSHPRNLLGRGYHRFVDAASGEVTPAFAVDRIFGSALVVDDTMHVFCTHGWGVDTVWVHSSKDLVHWEERFAFTLPCWRIHNTSVCRAGNGYTMAFEINKPDEETGVFYTIRFVTSPGDMTAWRLTPRECVLSRERFTACPTLRFFDGWYYLAYGAELPRPKDHTRFDHAYETRLARSRDLIQWHESPLNPLLQHSDDDRKIGSGALTPAQLEYIANAVNLNSSDVDFCEWNGQTVISYAWGDQHGKEFLAHARFDGTLQRFLEGFFPV